MNASSSENDANAAFNANEICKTSRPTASTGRPACATPRVKGSLGPDHMSHSEKWHSSSRIRRIESLSGIDKRGCPVVILLIHHLDKRLGVRPDSISTIHDRSLIRLGFDRYLPTSCLHTQSGAGSRFLIEPSTPHVSRPHLAVSDSNWGAMRWPVQL
jgi:hypothetical protein